MKPAIASLFALGTTFCLMGTKTRHEVPTFGTSARLLATILSICLSGCWYTGGGGRSFEPDDEELTPAGGASADSPAPSSDEPDEPDVQPLGEPDPPPFPKLSCGQDGERIIWLVNFYRVNHGKPEIPQSSALCTVARMHAEDLQDNRGTLRSSECSVNSWSATSWFDSCCYKNDNSNAECMWEKARQLSDYTGLVYESVALDGKSPEEVVKLWQNSTGHNELMLEKAQWKGSRWKSIGAAYVKGQATLWFGAEEDPTNSPM